MLFRSTTVRAIARVFADGKSIVKKSKVKLWFPDDTFRESDWNMFFRWHELYKLKSVKTDRGSPLIIKRARGHGLTLKLTRGNYGPSFNLSKR